jgi:hypothetical protein
MAPSLSRSFTDLAEGMTARWSDPGRLPAPPTGYVRAVNPPAAR